MNAFKNTRLIIPFIIVIIGIFNLMNPTIDGNLRTFWWFLTPFALVIGLLRGYMLFRQKKSGTTEKENR